MCSGLLRFSYQSCLRSCSWKSNVQLVQGIGAEWRDKIYQKQLTARFQESILLSEIAQQCSRLRRMT